MNIIPELPDSRDFTEKKSMEFTHEDLDSKFMELAKAIYEKEKDRSIEYLYHVFKESLTTIRWDDFHQVIFNPCSMQLSIKFIDERKYR